MAATVQIVEKNGPTATPSTTDKTSGTVRFCNADTPTPGTSNPMVVPTAGQDYSYDKWLILNVTVAPDTNISNLKFYTDGSSGFGAGVKLWAKAIATYPTGGPAEATATGSYADAFTYTSGSALSLGAGPYTGTGQKGSHAVLMLEVESTASQGSLTPETVTFSFDEI